MDLAAAEAPMLSAVVASGALRDDPFVLVDVGCGLGIDPAWRLFEPYLRGHGFDPQVAEIERLRSLESGPIEYHAVQIGLPGDHPLVRRRAERAGDEEPFQIFDRTSSGLAQRSLAPDEATLAEANDWSARELADERVGLAAALRGAGVQSVDFVKVDTDGSDLEVLVSFEELIRPAAVLGLMVEALYTGSADESANTFRNVDGVLKRHGFHLYALNVNRYSRTALPAQFEQAGFAQTVTGQPLWGDFVYLRDTIHPAWRRYGELTPTKLLKLACLYELFRVPDCAAELLLAHRPALAPLVDVEELLDRLTPPLHGRRVGYREYVDAFTAAPRSFFPPEPSLPARVARRIGREWRRARPR